MSYKPAAMLIFPLLLTMVQPGSAQVVPSVQPGQLDNATNPREIRQSPAPIPTVTERQAVELARQKFAGNILRISLIGEGSGLRYQIRMENEGKIFTVFVNAYTGAVSGG